MLLMPEHVPVLLNEVIELLKPKDGDVVVDATVGFGGHARSLCTSIGKKGILVGLDQDGRALAYAREHLGDCPGTLFLEKQSFRTLGDALDRHGIAEAHAMLFDLGISSPQIESSGRGFSFLRDEPLLMTFNDTPQPEKMTARDIVNDWTESDMANVLFAYGEERFARRIARAIAASRDSAPIETSRQLADIVSKSVPSWYRAKKTHPATKVFQALRMAVNDEPDAIREGLSEGFRRLAYDGRMAVISFHRIEDRIVKTFFNELAREGNAKLLTKKPIVPSTDEIIINSRARSAKLRGIQKN